MEDLVRSVARQLDRGERPRDALARLGVADPSSDAEELVAAASDPLLAPVRVHWLCELLRTARPGFGARVLRDLARERGEEGLPPLDLVRLRWLPRIVGSSNVLARMLVRAPHLADELEGDPPPPPALVPDAAWSSIRETKYRGLLRIAARDLAGRSVAEGVRELSDLADHCIAAGLVCAAETTGADPPSVLALGKLGGRELNFSSDVDLLFVYDAPPGSEEEEERHTGVSKLVRVFKAGLERAEADGFAYRVDLDLRPDGPQGPLANTVEAALGYYEALGHDWERQMLIRLRPVAGPLTPARAFAQGIVPFVYRRLIDPSVARSVRAMKLRIEDERRKAGRDLEFELKEGPGGIRDVEFLVQALQLFHGGRHPAIRIGNVLDALDCLVRERLLPEAAGEDLARAYGWLRRAEHAIQMVEERQTQRFPREAEEQVALARRLGYDEAEGERARAHLLSDWTACRSVVRLHFDALVLGGEE